MQCKMKTETDSVTNAAMQLRGELPSNNNTEILNYRYYYLLGCPPDVQIVVYLLLQNHRSVLELALTHGSYKLGLVCYSYIRCSPLCGVVSGIHYAYLSNGRESSCYSVKQTRYHKM